MIKGYWSSLENGHRCPTRLVLPSVPQEGEKITVHGMTATVNKLEHNYITYTLDNEGAVYTEPLQIGM
jgi:hypothetical protein